MKSKLKTILKSISICIFILLISFSLVSCGEKPEEDTIDQPTIDIDLSSMSSTMMYSYVSNMIEKPNDYKGKYVKAKGVHKSYTNNKTNITYHAILIYDSTTCCSQALEFVLEDETKYPSIDQTITIEGTFGTYTEGNNTYCCLNPSKFL
ncbi:MAG: hypothetical protein IKJ33_03785 [Clostridia bacterium]|nr:hypothetical protein [Clostridia bacterium]